LTRDRRTASAQRQHQTLTLEFISVGQYRFETALRTADRLLNTTMGDEVHARILGSMNETIDDGLRGVCNGEHASIVLGFEFYPASFKPFDGMSGLEGLKRTQQGCPASRVMVAQLGWIEAGMSDIATASA